MKYYQRPPIKFSYIPLTYSRFVNGKLETSVEEQFKRFNIIKHLIIPRCYF